MPLDFKNSFDLFLNLHLTFNRQVTIGIKLRWCQLSWLIFRCFLFFSGAQNSESGWSPVAKFFEIWLLNNQRVFPLARLRDRERTSPRCLEWCFVKVLESLRRGTLKVTDRVSKNHSLGYNMMIRNLDVYIFSESFHPGVINFDVGSLTPFRVKFRLQVVDRLSHRPLISGHGSLVLDHGELSPRSLIRLRNEFGQIMLTQRHVKASFL